MVFDQVTGARSAAPMASILFGPGVSQTVWVDGRVQQVAGASVAVPAGSHLVQVLDGATTRTLQVVLTDAGDRVAIVSPEKLSGLSLNDEANQPLLDVLIDATGSPSSAYVWTGSRTWKATDKWELLPSTAATGPGRPNFLLPGSIATLATGGVVMIAGAAYYFPNRTPAEPDAPEDYHDYQARMLAKGAGLGLLYSGLAATAVGAAGVGVSLAVPW
jgi:hypothetical protein